MSSSTSSSMKPTTRQSTFPWKGNIDVNKLKEVVERKGPEQVAYISFEHSVNMAGGQPVSMDNMREVYHYCRSQKVPVFFDATRVVENAYMIQRRDPRYRDTQISDILREMMIYGDGCTVSGKKDFLINIGGLLAFRDNDEWAEKAEDMLRVYEGLTTDGGLATADLAAIAVGVQEMLDDRYIRSRVRQTQLLGRSWWKLAYRSSPRRGATPSSSTPSASCPTSTRISTLHSDWPLSSTSRTGVRAMERGNVSKGRNPETNDNYRPALELVRLTLPRRVYTNDHIRSVAAGIIRLYERRNEIAGLQFVYEPSRLRFFQGRFEPVGNR